MKRIIIILCCTIYSALFIFTVYNGYTNALHYPFDRLLIGKTFYYPLYISPHTAFKAYLLSCKTKSLEGSYGKDYEVDCKVFIGNTVHTHIFTHNTVHTPLWLVLMLACSSLFLIMWGFGVLYARRDMSAELFAVVTYSVAINILVYIDVFFIHTVQSIFPLISAAIPLSLFYVVFTMRDNFIVFRNICYVLVIIPSIILNAFIFFKSFPFEIVYTSTIVMMLILNFVIMVLLLFPYHSKIRFLMKRNSVVAGAIFAGGILPIVILCAGMFVDMSVHPLFLLLLIVAMPVSIGNGLLANYSVGSIANIPKNITIMLVDIVIAIAVATGLIYLFNFYSIILWPWLIITIFLVAVCVLLYIRLLIVHALDDIIFLKNDEYSLSLQRITEIITSPKNLKEKLDSIEQELKALVKVQKITYIVLDDFNYDDKRVVAATSESAIITFFKNRRETITSASFFSNQENDKVVEEYIRKNNIEACIPVFIDNSLQGVLLLHNKGDYFTNIELNFLSMLALQVHQLMVNSKALQEYINARDYEKELDLASYIQLRLFPKKPPHDCGIQFSIYSRPYLKVTGDYYDIIPVDKNRVAVVIADISGHGLSAAMILSATSAMINGMLKENKGIDKVVAELNHFLTIRYTGFELITLFIGLYNKLTRSMEYINAGHIAPMVVSKDKKIYHLEGRSKILGVDPVAQYYPSRYSFSTGDEMILYTDGLTDLYNGNSDITFGEDSLNTILTQSLTKPIEEKIHAITEGIVTFGQEYIKDDITVIGMHFD